VTGRIDVHQHVIPPSYRAALRAQGIDADGGRPLPDWDADAALELMDGLGTAACVLSVSTPGTAFLAGRTEAAALAREINDDVAALVAAHPRRFGFLASLPLPDVPDAVTEAARSLDELGADGVVLLANARATYLGAQGQDGLFEVLDDRSAVVLVHPAELPARAVPGIPPFAADFLLDTSRAAFLLVRNGVLRRYPRIRFVLSHGGGFVPYASHRMAATIAGLTDRSLPDVLEDFRAFHFDTALSSSPAALPTLLAFARTDHVLFGSDWPYSPADVVRYFATALDAYPGLDAARRAAIDRDNAVALFPRLAAAPAVSRRGP
jgi:predicted TIM-barrel fold metal-dependent hydrolase